MTSSCPTCADEATAVTLQHFSTDPMRQNLAQGVDDAGNLFSCDVSLLEAPKLGDVVLVHAGVALAFCNEQSVEEPAQLIQRSRNATQQHERNTDQQHERNATQRQPTAPIRNTATQSNHYTNEPPSNDHNQQPEDET